MTAVALAQAILALIPLATSGTQHLWNFVNATRAATQQTGEWTPEAEAAYQAALLRKADAPESQPD